MPRRAEWRRLPDEPTHGVGLARAGVRELCALAPVRTAGMSALGIAVAVPFLALVLVGSIPGSAYGAYVLLAIVALALALVAVVAFQVVRRRLGLTPPRVPRPPAPLPRGLEAILPLPLPEGTFPVHVAVRFRGVLTGLDLAAATFVDGWLHVEGRRAAFALRATDGQAERREATLRVTFLDGQRVEVRPAGEAAFFRHAAGLWIADREHPEGESVLPPLTAQPALRLARRTALLLAITIPVPIMVVDTLLGHRFAFFWTFSAWTLGLLIAIHLAVVEGRLYQARAKSEKPSVLSPIEG